MARKFRKRPVIIDAIQWQGTNIRQLDEFGGERLIHPNEDGTLTIETLEGKYTAQKYDWIIRGVKNEVYPCKPDIFEQTYEEVE
jgi:hypothetical protein